MRRLGTSGTSTMLRALGSPEALIERIGVASHRFAEDADPAARVQILERQLEAMTGRLQSVFATASDLIASGDIDETLARITERAALQVRAPR